MNDTEYGRLVDDSCIYHHLSTYTGLGQSEIPRLREYHLLKSLATGAGGDFTQPTGTLHHI